MPPSSSTANPPSRRTPQLRKVERFSSRASCFISTFAFVLLVLTIVFSVPELILHKISSPRVLRMVNGRPTLNPPDETPIWKLALLWMNVMLLACLGPYVASLLTYRALRWRWVTSDHPLCEKCGYNLQGNTSGTCSECGTQIAAQRLICEH